MEHYEKKAEPSGERLIRILDKYSVENVIEQAYPEMQGELDACKDITTGEYDIDKFAKRLAEFEIQRIATNGRTVKEKKIEENKNRPGEVIIIYYLEPL